MSNFNDLTKMQQIILIVNYACAMSNLFPSETSLHEVKKSLITKHKLETFSEDQLKLLGQKLLTNPTEAFKFVTFSPSALDYPFLKVNKSV